MRSAQKIYLRVMNSYNKSRKEELDHASGKI